MLTPNLVFLLSLILCSASIFPLYVSNSFLASYLCSPRPASSILPVGSLCSPRLASSSCLSRPASSSSCSISLSEGFLRLTPNLVFSLSLIVVSSSLFSTVSLHSFYSFSMVIIFFFSSFHTFFLTIFSFSIFIFRNLSILSNSSILLDLSSSLSLFSISHHSWFWLI